jgi:hypothetical protein
VDAGEGEEDSRLGALTSAPGASHAPEEAARDVEAAALEPALLAAAIADALREVGVGGARRPRRPGVEVGPLGAGAWTLIVLGAALGAIGALVVGTLLGIALSGYLSAPNRPIEYGAGALGIVGVVRAIAHVRRAGREGSWRPLVGGALDFALALCALALAAGMRA